MKYRNPLHRKKRNTHALEVACGSCKTPVVIYEKGGNGNLIKMQMPRIIETEVNLNKIDGHLSCPSCKMDLARKGIYKDNLTYWVIRGRVNTRRLNNYFK